MKPSEAKNAQDFEMCVKLYMGEQAAKFYHAQITLLSEMIMGGYAESDKYTQKAISEQVKKYGFLQY